VGAVSVIAQYRLSLEMTLCVECDCNTTCLVWNENWDCSVCRSSQCCELFFSAGITGDTSAWTLPTAIPLSLPSWLLFMLILAGQSYSDMVSCFLYLFCAGRWFTQDSWPAERQRQNVEDSGLQARYGSVKWILILLTWVLRFVLPHRTRFAKLQLASIGFSKVFDF